MRFRAFGRVGMIGWCVAAWIGSVQSAQGQSAPATRPSAQVVSVAGFPTPIFQLRGSGTELGDGQAHALRDTIRELHSGYLKQFIRSDSARFAALAGAAVFEAHLPPEYRDEVRALAAGTGIDERQMMLAQCFLDLSPMMACSTVTFPGSASADGVARFGRNLDFPSFNVADKNTVLLIYHPTGKYAFAAVSWPGMMGVLSGMNEHGLCLANMEVSRAPRWPGALPYTLLYRQVLEQCKTVDQAVTLLTNAPRQTANNLMLMDADGNRAVAEITPDGVHARKAPDDQALICTNHQRGDDLDTPGKCRRYDSLHAQAKTSSGALDTDKVESMLASVAQGASTLQSMVFEPKNRVLYLATGKDAPHHSFARLDLAPLFGDAPAPSADLER